MSSIVSDSIKIQVCKSIYEHLLICNAYKFGTTSIMYFVSIKLLHPLFFNQKSQYKGLNIKHNHDC